MEYIANKLKLIKNNVPSSLKFVKEEFQKVFKKDNYAIYDEIIIVNPNAFSNFSITSKAQFVQKINNIDDDFYNFIKIEQ